MNGLRDRSDRPLGELSSGREVPPEPPENWLNLNRRSRDISGQLSDDFRRCLIKLLEEVPRDKLVEQLWYSERETTGYEPLDQGFATPLWRGARTGMMKKDRTSPPRDDVGAISRGGLVLA